MVDMCLAFSICVGFCIFKQNNFGLTVLFFCVAEGGRLEEELTYTRNTIGEGSGTTNQIVIQTPKSGNNILTAESFKQHRDALVKASAISITMFDM